MAYKRLAETSRGYLFPEVKRHKNKMKPSSPGDGEASANPTEYVCCVYALARGGFPRYTFTKK